MVFLSTDPSPPPHPKHNVDVDSFKVGIALLRGDFPLQNNGSLVGILSSDPRTVGQDCYELNLAQHSCNENNFDLIKFLAYKDFWFSFHKSIPFFFVYCRMRFLILGRSVRKRKKKRKNKIGKLFGARRPGTSA